MVRKFITYFDEQGNDYTDELISVVCDKLDKCENIKHMMVNIILEFLAYKKVEQ